jgi:hypothetical protein
MAQKYRVRQRGVGTTGLRGQSLEELHVQGPLVDNLTPCRAGETAVRLPNRRTKSTPYLSAITYENDHRLGHFLSGCLA